jgi:hypothetical protein
MSHEGGGQKVSVSVTFYLNGHTLNRLLTSFLTLLENKGSNKFFKCIRSYESSALKTAL